MKNSPREATSTAGRACPVILCLLAVSLVPLGAMEALRAADPAVPDLKDGAPVALEVKPLPAKIDVPLPSAARKLEPLAPGAPAMELAPPAAVDQAAADKTPADSAVG